ncbi:MAG: hypothetical protein J6T10_13520 [Methanobrevibacter sp.]|nr:hypothetical protein [Methanobrevibacter sp.]
MAGKTLNQLLSEEEKQNIIADYKNNISLRELEKKYHHNRIRLGKWLEEQGIKTTKGNHYRKYFHNEDFFEKIDTEEKAYWLGFMFADGYIINNENKYGQDQFGISVAEDSADVIEKFKKSLAATNPILYDNNGNRFGKQSLHKLVLCSQKTVNDLIDKGCFKQKTLILEPPKHVPENLIRHFLRGFFDGDGALCRCPKKDSSYISFKVSFTTTKPVAEWIYNIVKMGTINKEERREYTWYWKLDGNQQVIKFYHYLYDNATIWMDRKYNKFQELLEKYG